MATIYTNKSKEELPERAAHDHYRTEKTLVNAAVRYLYRTYLDRADVSKDRILDPSAGDGRWGQALAKAAVRYQTLIGVDIDRKWGMDLPEVQDWYYDWYTCDFIDTSTTFLTEAGFDQILSNPPYGPQIKGKKKIAKIFYDHDWEMPENIKGVTLCELFIRRGWDLLNPGGYMAYLLPLQLICGDDRYEGLWKTHAPIDVRACSRRPSFYGGGTNGTDYAFYIWHKHYKGHNANALGRQWNMGLLQYKRSDEK